MSYYGQYGTRSEKSILLAYVLWFLLGGFGVHRFYLGRIVSGLIMLGITVSFYASLFSSVRLSEEFATAPLIERGGTFWSNVTVVDEQTIAVSGLAMAVLGIWLIVDLFLIPGMARSSGLEAYRAPAPAARALPQGGTGAPAERRGGLPPGYKLPWRAEAQEAEPELSHAAAPGMVQDFDDAEAAQIRQSYDSEKKTFLTAYLLWLFGGLLGLHRLYVGGRPGALLVIGFVVGGAVLAARQDDMLHYAGFASLAFAALWFVAEGAALAGRVRAHNEALLDDIVRDLRES